MLRVPGIELAQVAARAVHTEVILGAADDPLELLQHLVRGGLFLARAEQAAEEPGVAERAAREHHGVRAALLEGVPDLLVARQAAGEHDRHRKRLHELAGERVVGRAGVLLRGVARVERDPLHAGLRHEPAREQDARAVTGLAAGTELDRHRQAAALARGARDRDRPVGIVEQSRPGSRPADLAHRAAHVDVDEVRAGVRRDRGRLPHDRGIVAEELHRDRVLVRVDAQELAVGAPVAVNEAEARHHLRHHQAGAVALRLKPHEPVADARERREHDTVGEPQAAERPAVGERAHTQKVALLRRRRAGRCRPAGSGGRAPRGRARPGAARREPGGRSRSCRRRSAPGASSA